MRILYTTLLLFILLGCNDSANISKGNENITVTLERTYDEVFEYEILPGMGPDSAKEKGSTVDLIQKIPYLLISNMMPPEKVINDVLSKGIIDAGMSGGVKWQPYKLKQGGFGSIIKDLKTTSGLGALEYSQPDNWVEDYEDWNVWVMYKKKGVPWKEHKRLNDAVVVIEKEIQMAKNNNEVSKLNELHLKNMAAGTQLSEFIMSHLEK